MRFQDVFDQGASMLFLGVGIASMLFCGVGIASMLFLGVSIVLCDHLDFVRDTQILTFNWNCL